MNDDHLPGRPAVAAWGHSLRQAQSHEAHASASAEAEQEEAEWDGAATRYDEQQQRPRRQ